MTAPGRRLVLLNPGPVNVSDRVRAAAASGDFCHREPEVLESLAAVRRKLCELFCPDPAYVAVAIAGSGSAALEMAVAATVQGDERLLVVNNGTYGERIRKMALAHGTFVAELHGPPTETPDLGRLDAMLAADRSIRWVAIVHHETTTGLLNPVAEVAKVAHARGCRVLVDSVSGLAGDPLPILEFHLDLVAGTANKCIQGLPGISFVLARREVVSDAASRPPRTMYLSLPLLCEEQDRGTHPFTLPVQILFAFDAALDELATETIAGRLVRMRRRSGQLRAGLGKLGLELLLPPPIRSSTLTSVKLPEGLDYTALHDGLKARGFVIYAGQGKLAAEIFRVANMGALEERELDAFLEALGALLAGAKATR